MANDTTAKEIPISENSPNNNTSEAADDTTQGASANASTASIPASSIKKQPTIESTNHPQFHKLPIHLHWPNIHPFAHPHAGPSWWWHHSGHGADHNIWRPHVMPRFDMYENSTFFVIEGDLPGSKARTGLSLEWMQPRTLLVRGTLEGGTDIFAPSADPDKEPEPTDTAVPLTEPTKVEIEQFQDVENIPSERRDVFATETEQISPDGLRCWMSERAVGPYFRSFTFPSAVNENGIKASLRDGLLIVKVPKDLGGEGPKINVAY